MTNEQTDRLAADKVMKWHYWDGQDDYDGPTPMFAICDGKVEVYGDQPDPLYAWSPTTKESHAALVREKMRTDGWDVDIQAAMRGQYLVEFTKGIKAHLHVMRGAYRHQHMTYATTAAALLAVGACKEEEING